MSRGMGSFAPGAADQADNKFDLEQIAIIPVGR